MAAFLVLIVILIVVGVPFIAIAFSKPSRPFENRPARAEPESAYDPLIDLAVKEAMKLDGFKRKTGYEDLRTLGFSDPEIDEFHDFFLGLDLRNQKKMSYGWHRSV